MIHSLSCLKETVIIMRFKLFSQKFRSFVRRASPFAFSFVIPKLRNHNMVFFSPLFMSDTFRVSVTSSGVSVIYILPFFFTAPAERYSSRTVSISLSAAKTVTRLPVQEQ